MPYCLWKRRLHKHGAEAPVTGHLNILWRKRSLTYDTPLYLSIDTLEKNLSAQMRNASKMFRPMVDWRLNCESTKMGRSFDLMVLEWMTRIRYVFSTESRELMVYSTYSMALCTNVHPGCRLNSVVTVFWMSVGGISWRMRSTFPIAWLAALRTAIQILLIVGEYFQIPCINQKSTPRKFYKYIIKKRSNPLIAELRKLP
jgi:hypothetical protein